MELKRINKDGKFDHIQVNHTGISPEQNFPEDMVLSGLNEGWVSITGSKLILHAEPEDLEYEILRTPGRYCLHCGERLPSEKRGAANQGAMAREHVAKHHKGVPSPDSSNPSGYVWLRNYELRLNSSQHDKFKKGA